MIFVNPSTNRPARIIRPVFLGNEGEMSEGDIGGDVVHRLLNYTLTTDLNAGDLAVTSALAYEIIISQLRTNFKDIREDNSGRLSELEFRINNVGDFERLLQSEYVALDTDSGLKLVVQLKQDGDNKREFHVSWDRSAVSRHAPVAAAAQFLTPYYLRSCARVIFESANTNVALMLGSYVTKFLHGYQVFGKVLKKLYEMQETSSLDEYESFISDMLIGDDSARNNTGVPMPEFIIKFTAAANGLFKAQETIHFNSPDGLSLVLYYEDCLDNFLDAV